MKTYSIKASDIKREWHVVDASDKILGRLATQIAGLLMGKHKPMFSRNLDVGDYVIVTNAEKVHVTGKKSIQKIYYHHTQYPGGLRSITLEKMMQTYPTRAIEQAVKGMLPHNHLRASMMKRLKVCAGEAHPYRGQLKSASVKTEGEDSKV